MQDINNRTGKDKKNGEQDGGSGKEKDERGYPKPPPVPESGEKIPPVKGGGSRGSAPPSNLPVISGTSPKKEKQDGEPSSVKDMVPGKSGPLPSPTALSLSSSEDSVSENADAKREEKSEPKQRVSKGTSLEELQKRNDSPSYGDVEKTRIDKGKSRSGSGTGGEAVAKDSQGSLNAKKESGPEKKKSSGSINIPPPPLKPPDLPRPPRPGSPDPKSSQELPPSAPSKVDRGIRPRRFIILVLIIVAFIAVVFAGAWFLLRGGDSGEEQPSPSPVGTSPAVGVSPSPLLTSPEFSPNADTDGDGLTDKEEIVLGTDLTAADTDGDGYTDKEEIEAGYDPLGPGKLDSDRDGLADPDEKCWGTDKYNPDTDGDGFLDGQEVVNKHDPLIPAPGDELTGPHPCL